MALKAVGVQVPSSAPTTKRAGPMGPALFVGLKGLEAGKESAVNKTVQWTVFRRSVLRAVPERRKLLRSKRFLKSLHPGLFLYLTAERSQVLKLAKYFPCVGIQSAAFKLPGLSPGSSHSAPLSLLLPTKSCFATFCGGPVQWTAFRKIVPQGCAQGTKSFAKQKISQVPSFRPLSVPDG